MDAAHLVALPPAESMRARSMLDTGSDLPSSPQGMQWHRERMAQHNSRINEQMAQQKAVRTFETWMVEEFRLNREMLISSLRDCIATRLNEHLEIMAAEVGDGSVLPHPRSISRAACDAAGDMPSVPAAASIQDARPGKAMTTVSEDISCSTRMANSTDLKSEEGMGVVKCDVVDIFGQSNNRKSVPAIDTAGPPEGDVVDILADLKKEKVTVVTPTSGTTSNQVLHGALRDIKLHDVESALTDHIPLPLRKAFNASYQAVIVGESSPEFGPRCAYVKRIVGHRYFEMLSTFFIFLSSGLVAAEMQYIGSQVGYDLQHSEFRSVPDPGWQDFFTAMSIFTNTIFLGEIILRLISAQQGVLFAPWLWLDTILVILGLLDLMNTLKIAAIFGSSDSTTRVAAIRLLRLFRIVRLIRVLRKKAALHSLFLLLKSIWAAVGASIWSFVLLLLIMVVAGLMMSQMAIPAMKDETLPIHVRLELFDYFGTFTKTMITMFEITTANWVPPCRLMMQNVGEGFAYIIVAYRCVFCFAVVNVIRAVFMAETMRVAAADDEVAMIKRDRAASFMRNKMNAVFLELDHTGDGLVTWEEFSTCLRDDEVMNFMSILDLDVHDCCNVFRILDTDGSGGVTCEEFMDGVKAIRGAAKRIDVATLMTVARKIESKLDTVLAQ